MMECTATLGMDMDVPNVDVVVCTGCLPFLQEMVNTFGNAGRDGNKAIGIQICKV